MNGADSSLLQALIFLGVLLVIYVLPTIVAVNRRHGSQGGIVVLNIFLGWTFLGWVVALAWACSGKQGISPREEVEQYERARRRVLLAGEGAVNADGTARQDIIASLTVGAKIYLKHEDDNQRDPLSIMALSAGEQIGILPPSAAGWKRGIAEAGEAEATVVSVERLPNGLLGVEVHIL